MKSVLILQTVRYLFQATQRMQKFTLSNLNISLNMNGISFGVELLVANTDSVRLGSGTWYILGMNQYNLFRMPWNRPFTRSFHATFYRTVLCYIRRLMCLVICLKNTNQLFYNNKKQKKYHYNIMRISSKMENAVMKHISYQKFLLPTVPGRYGQLVT